MTILPIDRLGSAVEKLKAARGFDDGSVVAIDEVTVATVAIANTVVVIA